MKLAIVTFLLSIAIFQTALAITSECKVELTSDHGQISSQNLTTANKNCTWIVKVPPMKQIKFLFSRVIMKNPQLCKNNYLQINETINHEKKILATYCNETTPIPLITKTSTAELYFQTNDTVQHSNSSLFQLAWVSIDNPNISLTCNKEFKEPTGVIMSPNYPNGNLLPFNCTYTISTTPGKIIQLSLTDLHIGQKTATTSRLNIHDGDCENAPLIESIADDKYFVPSKVFNSTTNFLTIKFIATQPLAKNQGFHAVYHTIDTKCGGLLTALNGTIQSPGYPNGYEPELNCTWRIQAPAGKVITLKYSAVNLTPHETCLNEHIQVTELHNNGTRGLLAKHCGDKLPNAIVSNSTIVDLLFRTGEKSTNKGFTLDYAIVDKKIGGN